MKAAPLDFHDALPDERLHSAKLVRGEDPGGWPPVEPKGKRLIRWKCSASTALQRTVEARPHAPGGGGLETHAFGSFSLPELPLSPDHTPPTTATAQRRQYLERPLSSTCESPSRGARATTTWSGTAMEKEDA